MTYKQLQNKTQPSKIQYIEDKKIQRNGKVSYLVKYRGVTQQNWASADYLCLDSQNKKSIEIYQKLMQAESILKKGSQNQSDSGHEKQIYKTKSKAKKQKKALKIKQKQTKAIEIFKAGNLIEKKIELIKKPEEFSRKNKNQKTAVQDYYSQVEVDPQELVPEHVQNVLGAKKQLIAQQKVIRPKKQQKCQQKKGEGKFKIIKAQTNSEGQINFQIKYQNGATQWVEGQKIKSQYPLKVIKFYEKRISWVC